MFNSTQIFISYRRNSGAGYAGRLYQYLKKDFKVFFDTDSITIGEKFDRRIKKEIKKSTLLLVILDEQSVSEFEKRKNRDDYMLFELETAYANEIPIIPILLNNSLMPNEKDLPSSIAFLSSLNAFGIRHEKFSTDAEELIRNISETYGNNRFIKKIKICCINLLILLILFGLRKPITSLVSDINITGQSIFSLISIGGDNINYKGSNEEDKK